MRLVADADAAISRCQFYVRFRYRRIGDCRSDAKVRAHFPKQHGLVLPTPVDGESNVKAGLGLPHQLPHRGQMRPRRAITPAAREGRANVLDGVPSVTHPSQASVVLPGRMRVFDTPTICSGRVASR